MIFKDIEDCILTITGPVLVFFIPCKYETCVSFVARQTVRLIASSSFLSNCKKINQFQYVLVYNMLRKLDNGKI